MNVQRGLKQPKRKRIYFKKLRSWFLRLVYKNHCVVEAYWLNRPLFNICKIGHQNYVYIGKGLLLKTNKKIHLDKDGWYF